MAEHSPASLKAALAAYAAQLGFDGFGIAPPDVSAQGAAQHLKWLTRGHHGEMHYLARNPEARYDARSLLPECRSVVVLALGYYVPDENWPAADEPKVSRYAWGDDYHEVLREKLEKMAAWLEQHAPGKVKLCVDTSPLTEKAFAVAAGLGWQGRNSLVLNRELGSYFFIGLLLTSAEMPADVPALDACGTCTKCIVACPTDALHGPGILDARRCVSYLTTERKQPVEAHEPLNGWLYGCDTCQQVCPYNDAAPTTREPRFMPRAGSRSIGLEEAMAMDEAQFSARFEGTVFKRRKLERLQAQARNLLANDPGGDRTLWRSTL